MSRSRFFGHKFYLLMISSVSLLLPLSSAAYEEHTPEIRYGSCSQLQKNLNIRNNPNIVFKSFESARLMRKTHTEYTYLVYCNGGILINKKEGTVCRGYIGYSYAPVEGTATYFGDWGWTNGLPNDADTGKERYCRRLK